VEPNRDVLTGYINEHLDGSAERLAESISDALSMFPRLLTYIAEGVIPRIDTDAIALKIEEGVSALSKLLGMRVGEDVGLILMVTGFDSAVSAYSWSIYVGLEWFIEPNVLGLREEDPLRTVLSWLSRDPTGSIASSAIHELVHILTPKLTGDPLLARLLEEGRAVYIAWLLSGAKKEAVLPLVYHELGDYARCFIKMLHTLNRYVKGRIKLREDEFFAISEKDSVCGLRLSGYYLGLYLAQLIHDYYNGDLARLARLDNTVDLMGLLADTAL